MPRRLVMIAMLHSIIATDFVQRQTNSSKTKSMLHDGILVFIIEGRESGTWDARVKYVSGFDWTLCCVSQLWDRFSLTRFQTVDEVKTRGFD